MRRYPSKNLPPSAITPEPVYRRRREVLKLLGLGATALAAGCGSEAAPPAPVVPETSVPGTPLAVTRRLDDADGAVRTTFQDATHYNNFYEFGTGKGDPAARSGAFRPRPWSVEIAGLAEKTGRFALEDILKGQALEERIYRMRCVEGWSMVIPWAGFALADLLKSFKQLASAKYVAFNTLERPAQMPGLAYPVLDWPYREGLRMDEAMHPLTLLAVGMYGRTLPNQNGAPLRLVVPWKYGFKSIKSIVRIRFTERMPMTTWAKSAPNEYGFFSNVNPDVSHPRWSQANERRIGEYGRRNTLLFNGYGEQVAQLYQGMD